VSLFCLGLIMSSHQLRLSAEVWSNVLLKNVLHPVLMFGICLLFAVEGILEREIILLFALPSATITAMFANDARLYQAEAAASILLGTILSIATFSIAIWLTAGMGH